MAQGIVQLASPSQLAEAEAKQQQDTEAAAKDGEEQPISELVAFIREEFREARDSRYTTGVSGRLINALRVYKGVYSPQKLTEVQSFGGSEVYSKITATKCRAATALLRDLYLSSDRAWELKPSPIPTIPDEIDGNIVELVRMEAEYASQAGEQITETQMRDRLAQLHKAAQLAAHRQADKAAKVSTRQLNDILVEGGYYKALRAFLIDLPIFPIACIKGPVVKNFSKVRWVDGQAQVTYKPKLFWERVSPLDLYFTADASDVAQSNVMEHVRYTRQDLYGLIGVAGFDEDAIRGVLEDFESGRVSQQWRDWFETEREKLEERDFWQTSRGKLIDGVEFHGCIPGKLLVQFGWGKDKIEDEDAEYMVDIWIIDRHAIKVQINPSVDMRAPYYTSSFEKIPGSIFGYGLPDILDDVQSVMNATMRAMVNNLSIASGPQVVVNDSRLASTEDGNELYPWKRWHVTDDPLSNKGREPITFFQPQSNSQELLGVYQQFNVIADEISAIPRYMTGGGKVGGAGRTASGLAMLMENSSKVMQNVAANVDDDILDPSIKALYEMTLLTQKTPIIRGDETIRVRGVTVAVAREADRMRRLEFLQMTGNPTDLGIMGIDGRAAVLRELADDLGMDGVELVPSEEELEMMKAAQEQQQRLLAQQEGPQGSAGQQQPGVSPERAPAEAVREPYEGVR